MCTHARDNQAYDTFYDMLSTPPKHRHIDLAEFYDGGTYLNEEIGSLNNDDGYFINNYYLRKAQNTPLEFPVELDTFKSCRANAVMCCW